MNHPIDLDPPPAAGQDVCLWEHGAPTMGEASEENKKAPTRRTKAVVLDHVHMLKVAAGIMLKGGGPMQIARRLGCPYPTASKLHDAIYEEVMGRIQDDFDPEVLKALKREKREGLIREMRRCEMAVARSFKDGKPNTRPYSHYNTAVKLLNQMDGDNAPAQFESRNLNVAVDYRAQQALVTNPEYCELIMRMEEIERAAIAPESGLKLPQP